MTSCRQLRECSGTSLAIRSKGWHRFLLGLRGVADHLASFLPNMASLRVCLSSAYLFTEPFFIGGRQKEEAKKGVFPSAATELRELCLSGWEGGRVMHVTVAFNLGGGAPYCAHKPSLPPCMCLEVGGIQTRNRDSPFLGLTEFIATKEK